MTRQFPNFKPADIKETPVNRSKKTAELTKLILEVYDYFKENNIPINSLNFKACVESEGVEIHLSLTSFKNLCSNIICIIDDGIYEKELRDGTSSAITIYRRILEDRETKRKQLIMTRQKSD